MFNNLKVNAIIQARMTSSRLPGKVLYPLIGKPVLQHIIERLRESKYIDNVIVATTINQTDEPIIELCKKIDCLWFRGSENNVLERVLETAHHFKTDLFVEITADCPCICPSIVDDCIEKIGSRDYISNVIKRTYPRGLDVQVLPIQILERIFKEVDNDIDKQHVTSWVYLNPKSYLSYNRYCLISNKQDYSNIRLTLDTEEDYKLIKFVYEAFRSNEFNYADLVELIQYMPEMFNINKHIEQKSYYKELNQWYNENSKPL